MKQRSNCATTRNFKRLRITWHRDSGTHPGASALGNNAVALDLTAQAGAIEMMDLWVWHQALPQESLDQGSAGCIVQQARTARAKLLPSNA
eukprot:819074-Amphidinium_carterae.1